jgi:hypothetical protein
MPRTGATTTDPSSTGARPALLASFILLFALVLLSASAHAAPVPGKQQRERHHSQHHAGGGEPPGGRRITDRVAADNHQSRRFERTLQARLSGGKAHSGYAQPDRGLAIPLNKPARSRSSARAKEATAARSANRPTPPAAESWAERLREQERAYLPADASSGRLARACT